MQAPLSTGILGVVASPTACVADGIPRQVAVEKGLQVGPHGTPDRSVGLGHHVDVPLGIVDVIQPMAARCETLIEHGLVAALVLVGGHFHRERVNHLVYQTVPASTTFSLVTEQETSAFAWSMSNSQRSSFSSSLKNSLTVQCGSAAAHLRLLQV